VKAKETTRDEGFWEGMYRGAGGMLVIALLVVAVVYVLKRVRGRYAIVRTDDKAQSASA